MKNQTAAPGIVGFCFVHFFDGLFSTLSPLVIGKEARVAAARAAGFSGEKIGKKNDTVTKNVLLKINFLYCSSFWKL